jgi:hypothetical protein
MQKESAFDAAGNPTPSQSIRPLVLVWHERLVPDPVAKSPLEAIWSQVFSVLKIPKLQVQAKVIMAPRE